MADCNSSLVQLPMVLADLGQLQQELQFVAQEVQEFTPAGENDKFKDVMTVCNDCMVHNL
jgi:hypothetical protein